MGRSWLQLGRSEEPTPASGPQGAPGLEMVKKRLWQLALTSVLELQVVLVPALQVGCELGLQWALQLAFFFFSGLRAYRGVREQSDGRIQLRVHLQLEFKETGGYLLIILAS